MIHVINLIFKLLVTMILFFPIGGCLTLLALIYWNEEYMSIGENILDIIWKKNK